MKKTLEDLGLFFEQSANYRDLKANIFNISLTDNIFNIGFIQFKVHY
jgi:hypothetical protein